MLFDSWRKVLFYVLLFYKTPNDFILVGVLEKLPGAKTVQTYFSLVMGSMFLLFYGFTKSEWTRPNN
jgi:hypothetical protein